MPFSAPIFLLIILILAKIVKKNIIDYLNTISKMNKKYNVK